MGHLCPLNPEKLTDESPRKTGFVTSPEHKQVSCWSL